MSKTIDERVVSMQFDNGKFEQNVATSMSTLDKLKAKLNFKGIDTSFSSITKAANNVNISGLGKAVDSVQMKFSALQVAGITALTNITNTAVNAGKRIVSSLTLDQVRAGFNEYELKMGSIQTIMASTGKSLETVNKCLNELNEYSDKTIYSFSDMTQNIGKFTNAGVKLEDAVMAIKGVSNEAAVSGANANEAARAMYNFAQALSAGYVKLIDWKSIENANMATVEFKQQLIDTAVQCGTLSKRADGMYDVLTKNASGKDFEDTINSTKNFNEALSYQWMTSEVLIKTLKNYADENTAIGKKAFKAATEIKTFTQMMDALKESIGSGWAQTWELIFGDFNQAKTLWTGIYNKFDKIFGKIADARNKLLGGALKNPFSELINKFNDSGLGKITKKIDSVSKSLEYYQKVVNDVWRGDYKSQPYRYDLLKKAGYDNPRLIQSLVNKGYQYKLTIDDINEAEKKYGKTAKQTSKVVESTAISIEKLSDKQLKNKGFTEEEIKMLRQLGEEAKKTGKPINQLIKEMGEVDGRSLLIKSFENIGKGIKRTINSIKKAWGEIFSPVTSVQIYNLIKSFNELSKKFLINKKKTEELKRTFKGLFATLDIVSTLTAGPLKIAFKVLRSVLKLFNVDVLKLTAKIGDNIVRFNDWLDSVVDFEKIFDKISPTVEKAVNSIKEWFESFKKSDFLKDVKTNITNFLELIKNSFPSVLNKVTSSFKNMGNMLSNTWSKIKEYSKYIRDAVTQSEWFNKILLATIDVGNKTVNFFKDIIDAVKLFFLALKSYDDLKFSDVIQTVKDFFSLLYGRTSNVEDSKVFEGAEEGTSNFTSTLKIKMEQASNILDDFRIHISNFVNFIKNSINDNLGSILAIALLGSLIYESHKTLKVLDKFASAISTFSSSAKQFTSSLTGFISNGSKVLKSIANRNNAEIIMVFARAIGMLALSLWVIALIPEDRLGSSVATLIGLMTVFGIFSAILLKIPNLDKMTDAWKPMIAFAGAMLILASSLAIITNLDQTKLVNSVAALGVLMAMMGLVSGALGKYAPQLSKGSGSMIMFALSLRVMVGVLKEINELKIKDPTKVISVMISMLASMFVLTAMSKRVSFSSGVGMIALVLSIKVLLKAMSSIAKIDGQTIEKGLTGVVSILLVLVIVMRVVRRASADSSKAGVAVLAMSAGVLLIAYAMKELAKIDPEGLDRAEIAVTKLLLVFAAIVAVSYFAGQHAAKAGAMLLLMSVSIGILTGVMWLMSLIDPKGLDRALDAVKQLMLVFSVVVAASGLAKDAKGTVIALSVTIAALALSLIALTFIDPEKLMTSVKALSIVMIAFSAMLATTGAMADNVGKTAVVLLELVGVVALLGLVLAMMTELNVQNAFANASALSVLLLAMSVSLNILTVIKDSKSAAIAVGVLALLAVVTALLGLVLAEMTALKVQDAIPNAVALSVLLLAMSKALVVLSGVGAVGKFALIGIGVLAVFIAGMLGLMTGIGELVDKCPTIQTFVDKTIPLMNSLGTALGNFVGGFIGGVVGGSLVAIGTSLSDFWNAIQPFLEGVKGLDPSVTEGIKNLCTAILALTGTSVIDKLSKWLIGGTDFTDLGRKLVIFGLSMRVFSDTVKGIDIDAVNASSKAAKGLADLAKNMPSSGGLLQKIIGEKSWDTIGEGLVKFGKSLVDYGKAVIDLTPEYSTAISNSATAAKSLNDVLNSIPSSDGWLQKIIGDKSWSTISEGLEDFGKTLVGYGSTVSGLTPEYVTGINTSIDAAKSLSSLQDSLPKSGGLFQEWFGNKTWSSLSDGLIDFGKDLASYSIYAACVNIEALNNSVVAAQKLSDFADQLPDNKLFTNETTLPEFGDSLVKFGKKLTEFSDELANVNTDRISSTTTFVNGLKNIAFDGMDGFKNAITDSTPNVKEEINNMINAAITNLANANEMFSIEGSNVITSFIIGMNKKTRNVKEAIKEIVASASDSAGSNYSYNLFYDAGDYVVQGFAAGITASTWRAEARAKAMARAAEQAAEEELGINSPSKVFYKMGKFTVMGFVNALHDNISKSESASADMASSAVKGFKSAISKVSNLIETGMDTNPTIRPVVDLSNVKSGANAINGMLSGNRIMGLSTSKINYNVSGISRTMNNRQNGNSDVVDAVESLRNSVANLKPGNAYTINGITYDDGSNVASAIETLIRAAKIERRV